MSDFLDHDSSKTRKLVEILWNYNKLNQPPCDAEFLIIMGTDDERVVDYAYSLHKQFNYRYVVVSGGVSHQYSMQKKNFGDTEANFFFKKLISYGVDSSRIIIENEAKNTGDNILLSKNLLMATDQNLNTGHLVHIPSMERRALATAECQWPEISWSVSSQQISYADYVVDIDEDRFIHGIVGDTFRILDYPSRRFQTIQPMPESVKNALDDLILLGFNRRIPSNYKLI